MSFSVFISHSTKDAYTVYALKGQLQLCGINVRIAEENPMPGNLLSQKIVDSIKASDCVIAILSSEGTRSKWVDNEVGIAFGTGKHVIPIVEKGVKVEGVLEGREYITFDSNNPLSAFGMVISYVHQLKLKKDEADRIAAIGGLVLLCLMFAALSEKG